MRRDAESFQDAVLELVHIAGTLREALRIEELLTDEQVDYVVQTGVYRSGFLFHTEKAGAFFYVASNSAETCRNLLARHGHRSQPHAQSSSQFDDPKSSL